MSKLIYKIDKHFLINKINLYLKSLNLLLINPSTLRAPPHDGEEKAEFFFCFYHKGLVGIDFPPVMGGVGVG